MTLLSHSITSDHLPSQIYKISQASVDASHYQAKDVLDEQELFVWQNLEAKTHRQAEWLRGRLVAKETVQQWALTKGLGVVDYQKIHILQNDLGRPEVKQSEWSKSCSLPSISITHGKSYSLAAVSPDERFIGLDYENLSERSVGPWLARAFRDEELERINTKWPEHLLLLWTAKEAASKANGTGLQGRWRDWVVVGVDREFCKVTIEFENRQFEVVVERLWDEFFGLCLS